MGVPQRGQRRGQLRSRAVFERPARGQDPSARQRPDRCRLAGRCGAIGDTYASWTIGDPSVRCRRQHVAPQGGRPHGVLAGGEQQQRDRDEARAAGACAPERVGAETRQQRDHELHDGPEPRVGPEHRREAVEQRRWPQDRDRTHVGFGRQRTEPCRAGHEHEGGHRPRRRRRRTPGLNQPSDARRRAECQQPQSQRHLVLEETHAGARRRMSPPGDAPEHRVRDGRDEVVPPGGAIAEQILAGKGERRRAADDATRCPPDVHQAGASGGRQAARDDHQTSPERRVGARRIRTYATRATGVRTMAINPP